MEKKLQTKLDQKKFAKLFEQAAGEEIASLRSANIKQYDLGLGRRQAVLYPEAVHYQEENGEWTEIDNTLVMDTDVYGRAVLRAKASPLKTQLAAYADSGALVRLESKGRVLMWSFEQPAAAVTRGCNPARRSAANAWLHRRKRTPSLWAAPLKACWPPTLPSWKPRRNSAAMCWKKNPPWRPTQTCYRA